MNIQEIRQKYPQYESVPDEKLADAFYSKFYSDKMNRDDFNKAIGIGANAATATSAQPAQDPERAAKLEALKNAIGADRTPIDTLQDVGAGLMGGAQRLAVLLGQGGQNIASLLTGGYAPRVDIAEELGLGKNNRFDLMDKLASNKPSMYSGLLKTGGQFTPAMLSGGATLPGQAAAAGLWGATQHVPESGGMEIPSRLWSGAKDAAGTYVGGKVLGGIAKEVTQGFPFIKSFMPSRPTADLMENLGGVKQLPAVPPITPQNYPNMTIGDSANLPSPTRGGLANSQDNANMVAQAINQAAEKQKADALVHKQNVYDQTAKTRVDVNPASALPEGNIPQVLKQIGIDAADVSPEQIKSFQAALKDYRKAAANEEKIDAQLKAMKDKKSQEYQDLLKQRQGSNSLEDLQNNIEDIFQAKEFTPRQEGKLDELMSIPVSKNLKYFSPKNQTNWDAYNGKIKELHDQFVQNPNFQNAHELESQLNSQMRTYKKMSEEGKLDRAGSNDYDAIIKAKTALSEDMDSILKSLPDDMQKEWGTFKQKYRENYGAYLNKDRPNLIEIAKGKTTGTTPSELRSIFAYPDEKVNKVLGDLSPEVKNRILYNELTHLDPKDPKAVVEYLDKLEKDAGYSHLITNEVKAARDEIKRRIGRQGKLLAYGTLGAAPGATKAIKILKSIWTKAK